VLRLFWQPALFITCVWKKDAVNIRKAALDMMMKMNNFGNRKDMALKM